MNTAKDLFARRLLQKPCGKVNFNLFWTTKQSLSIHLGTFSFSLKLNCSNTGGIVVFGGNSNPLFVRINEINKTLNVSAICHAGIFLAHFQSGLYLGIVLLRGI